jgi:hypothetical protein
MIARRGFLLSVLLGIIPLLRDRLDLFELFALAVENPDFFIG